METERPGTARSPGASKGTLPVRRGLPLPGLGRFHPYAWTCFVLILASVIWNVIAHVAAHFAAHSSRAAALSIDAWIFAGLSYVIAPMIGAHALIKYRWPGRTATEQARKPMRWDVWLVGVAFVVGVINLVVLLLPVFTT